MVDGWEIAKTFAGPIATTTAGVIAENAQTALDDDLLVVDDQNSRTH